MKVIVNEDFTTSLEEVASFAERSGVVPIREYVFMEVDDFSIVLRASATDLYVELKIPLNENCSVEETGKTLLDPKLVLPFLKKVGKGKPVAMQVKDKQLVMVAGKSKLQLQTLDTAEFPAPPKMENVFVLRIKEELKNALRGCQYAVAQTIIRPILKGIHLRLANDKAVIEATDSYRLARYVVNAAHPDLEEYEAVFYPNRKAFSLMEEWENAKLIIGEKYVVLQEDVPGYTIYLNKIEGTYPDTEKIVKIQESGRAVLPISNLKNALDGVNIILSNTKGSGNHFAVIKVTEGKMIVERNDESSSFVDEIDAETGGNKIVLGMNPRFIYDALSAIESQRVVIIYNNNVAPVYFIPEGNEEKELHLILPVRMAG